MNGATLPSAPADIQNTVLDELHRYARIRDRTVTAKITDEVHRRTLHIRVLTDGSSEIVGTGSSPMHTQGSAPPVGAVDQETTTLRLWPSGRWDNPSSEPVVTEPTEPDPFEAESTSRESSQPEPSSPEPSQPGFEAQPLKHSSTENHELAATAVTVPDELSLTISQVNDAVAAGDLTLAESFIDRLKDQSEDVFGPEHAYTLEAYALDGYIAHLRGNHAHATAVSLYLAHLRLRQGDLRAEEEIKRAAAAWNAVDSPLIAIAQGEELLALLENLAEEQGRRVEDLPESLRVRDRLSTLAEEERAQSVAVGLDPAG